MDSERIEEFFREFYEKEILDAAKQGKKSVTVDFDVFDRYCHLIAEKFLNDPENIIAEIEKAASEALDLPEGPIKFYVRFKNLPEQQNIRIRSLRSEHIGKFLCVDGIVKRASEVKPKIDVAEFECECGNRISVKQTEQLLKYPAGCDMCGNKRGFRLVNKNLFDSRWLVVEEPSEIASGEKPGQVSVYLKEDLTTPEMQRKCDPGNRIKLTGIIRELPQKTKGGARKVQSDIFMEANYVEPTEIEWEEVEINREDEENIKALASDPDAYKKIVASIAPSIYGMEDVKEAIFLQMLGGVQQKLPDRTKVRGDIHILLLGDPAVAKCVDGNTEVLLSNGQLAKIRDIAEEELKKNKNLVDDGFYAITNHDILSMNGKGKLEDRIANIAWKRSAPEYMYYVKTQTGREITVTPTHPFFVCNGAIASKKAEDAEIGDFIAVPRILRINPSDKIEIKIERSRSNNANHIKIPKKVIPELSRIIGYLIGDGYVQKTKTGFCIWLTNNNKKILEDFKDSVKKTFGLDCIIRKPHEGKEALDIYTSSIEFGRFLRALDSSIMKKSENKRVPQIIMQALDKNAKEFLKAYFDSEATFSTDNIQISCTSASKHLLKDVQFLLLRFGIMSQIGYTYSGCNGWKKKYFRIKITGSENVKRFIDVIGFGKKTAGFSFKKLHSNIDVIPSVSKLLKSIRTRKGLTQYDMGIPRSTYQHYERGDRSPSRRDLKKIVETIKLHAKNDKELMILEFLANSDILWDKIVVKKRIKPKEEWVYDLQVEGTHNFVANGIFVHNSQLLKMVSQLIPRGKYVSGKGASVKADEPVIIRNRHEIKMFPFGEFADKFYKKDEDGFSPLDRRIEALSLNLSTLKFEWKPIKSFYRHNVENDLVKFELETGREITVTDDHSIFTLENGKIACKQASLLKERDFAIVPAVLPVENPIDMGEDAARLLGYFIAEGHLHYGKGSYKIEFTLGKNETEIIQDIKVISKRIFGKEASQIIHGKNGIRIVINGKWPFLKLKELLGNAFGKKAKEKVIPNIVFNSSENCRKAFVTAYMKGDKGVTKSKGLMSGLLYLLLGDGVIGSCIKREDNGIRKIEDRIITACGKRYDLKSPHPDKTFSNRYKNIPISAAPPLLRKHFFKKITNSKYSRANLGRLSNRLLLERLMFVGNRKMRTKEMKEKFGAGIKQYMLTKKHFFKVERIEKEWFVALSDEGKSILKEYEEFKKLCESDMGFVRIKSISREKPDSSYVYDFSVEGENFVSGFGGILCHNTGAGLTATVFRDEELMGGWVLEAGAMVLCNKGVICLHPDAKVIANNRIVSLKNLFDEAAAKKGVAGPEIIEFNDICLPVVSFDKNSMATEATDAVRIGRKMYKGKLLKIKTESGFETILTPNHMLLDGNSLKWKPAKDFSARDFIVSPLKLPENKNEMLIFDLIPDYWKVSLSREEKSELKKIILGKYRTLADFNKKFCLNEHIISGNRQMTMKIFRKALADLGIYDKWKTRRLKFIRKHDGERLKVSSITPELGYILGFILGDGYVKSTQRRSEIAIVQSKNHKKYIERLLSSWGSVFEKKMCSYNVSSETRIRGSSVKSDSIYLKSGSNILSLVYEKIVGNNLENILLLNDTVLKAFIAGGMDADGCLSVKKGLKKNKVYKTVNTNFLLTKNKEVAKNFMLALRRFDCYSKLIEGRAVHNILISGRKDIFALKNAISCFSEKMKKSIPCVKNRVSSASDKLPSFPVSEICKGISKTNKSLLLSKGVWSNVYNFMNFRQQPSRDQLQKIIERVKTDRNIEERALTLLKRDYFLDRIKNIKEIEHDGFVYDLLVPEMNNFVADGFFVHNCIDEFDKMTKDDQIAMHEGMEQQSYHPNTEITLSDGSKHKIGMFVDGLMERNKTKIIKGKDCEILPVDSVSILTTDFSKIYPAKANRVSRHIAPEKFIRITYSNGRSILVTPEHPVFVLDGCEIKTVPTEFAKKDMFVPMPKKLQFSSADEKLKRIEKTHFNEKNILHPERIDSNLARILGYYVSEGHNFVGKRCKEIGFTNSDEYVLGDIKSSMHSTFGIQPYSYERNPNVFINRYSSTQLHRFFEQNFPEVLKKARDKKIPEILLKYDENIINSFLSAAYLGDGFVDSERFGFSTTSLDLAKGYQELLLKTAIYSYIAEDEKQKAYKVVISGTESMKLFLENIVDKHDYRRDRIEAFIDRSINKNRQRGDFPYGFGLKIKEMQALLKIDDGYFQPSQKNGVTEQTLRKYIDRIEERTSCMRKAIESEKNMAKLRKFCKISQQGIENKYGVKHQTISYIERCKFHKRKNEIMRFVKEIALERIDKAENVCNKLEKFLDSDISWIKIKNAETVENKGCKYVYDVTVEPTKSFISECLVLHNTISIAKASIIATLPAQVSVLAGANPKFSRFDVYRPLAEQTDIPETLLSRFDLKFALRDVPDKERDEKLASHILETRLNPEIRKPEISPEFLRKFIAYVRQNCHPKMTKKALEKIKNFYVMMRGMYDGGDTVAITLRQNEALLRLAEASAKVRLSPIVEEHDAERAIRIMRASLQQFGYDYETGKIDVDRTEGTPSSQRSKIRILLDVIENLEKKIGKQVPKEDVIAEAEDRGLKEKDVEDMLQKLKREGMIFEPKHNVIQKL